MQGDDGRGEREGERGGVWGDGGRGEGLPRERTEEGRVGLSCAVSPLSSLDLSVADDLVKKDGGLSPALT